MKKNFEKIDVYKTAQLIVQINEICDKKKDNRCKECYLKSFGNKVLNIERYISEINFLRQGDLIVIRGGEPTMVKGWFEKFVVPALSLKLKIIIESDGYFIGRNDYCEIMSKLTQENIFMRISFDISHILTEDDFDKMALFANHAIKNGVKFGFYSLGMSKKQIYSLVQETKLEEYFDYFHPLHYYKRISKVKLSGSYLRVDGVPLKRIIEIKKKDTKEIYNKIAEKYNQMYFEPADYISDFLELLPQNGEILDIGCGTGINSNFVKERDFGVIGIDSSYGMVKIAKKNFPDINFKVSDMQKIKFEKGSFDGIISSFSLIHIPKNNILNVVNKLSKALKTNGLLYLSLQCGKSKEVFIKPFKGAGELFLNIVSFSEINRILKGSGFKVIFRILRSPLKNEIKFRKLYIFAKKKPD